MEDISNIRPSACFEVQKIIGVSVGGGNARNYQVEWAPTWVSGFHLVGCERLIEQFLQQQSEKSPIINNNDTTTTSGVISGDDLQNDLIEDEFRDDGLELPSMQHSTNDVDKQVVMVVNDDKDCNSTLFSNTVNDDVRVETNMEISVSNEEICIDDVHRNNQANTDLYVKIEDVHSNEDGEEENAMLFHHLVKKSHTNSGNTTANVDGVGVGTSDCQHRRSQCDFDDQFHVVEIKREEIILDTESETDQTCLINKDLGTESTLTEEDSTFFLHNEEKLKCNECSKTFSNKGTLTRHLLLHTGARPHKCTECDKTFSRKDTLTKHLRTHTGEKPYECSHCKRAFSDNRCLQKHIRLHDGEMKTLAPGGYPCRKDEDLEHQGDTLEGNYY